MKRREFAGLVSAAAALPAAVGAQSSLPVIGFLHSGAAEQNVARVAAFKKGLQNAGFVEGRDYAIEFRWSAGDNARLAGMAADFVARKVAVITTLSSTPAAVT